MSDRFHVTITVDLEVDDIAAVQAAAPNHIRQLIADQGGVLESPFLDDADQAAGYTALDPKAAMDAVVHAAVRRGLNTPELAGRWYELAVNCVRV